MAVDDNKYIRVILEARDNLSGIISQARKSVKKDLDELDKTFFDSRKNVNLYEESYDDLGKAALGTSKDIDKATVSVNKMTKALKNAETQSRRTRRSLGRDLTGFVTDQKNEVRGRRTIRDAQGRIIPGKGRDPGDKVAVDQAKQVRIINRELRDVFS
jgi:predicted  nucleic acid-binding Zn-ribbon protein